MEGGGVYKDSFIYGSMCFKIGLLMLLYHPNNNKGIQNEFWIGGHEGSFI